MFSFSKNLVTIMLNNLGSKLYTCGQAGWQTGKNQAEVMKKQNYVASYSYL